MEHQRSWNKIKSDPEKYVARLKTVRKAAKGKYNHEIYKKKYDKLYFGGLREKAILRDKAKCVDCGLTRSEHISIWGIDLHINHIDHTKRNEMENLETLCIRCHAKKCHY